MSAETLYPYALTTLQRVKDRIGITGSNLDALFIRLINAMTDHIESQCGGRRFLSTSYVNEQYSISASGQQEYLVLKQAPVTAIASFQFAIGLPPNKPYQEFLPTLYELVEGGKSGMIRVYGGMVRGTNVVRVSYTAGYLVDWPNAGSPTHTLPADLSDLCERMVIKIFKRREAEGKAREGMNVSQIFWSEKTTPEDQDCLNRYTRVPIFV